MNRFRTRFRGERGQTTAESALVLLGAAGLALLLLLLLLSTAAEQLERTALGLESELE